MKHYRLIRACLFGLLASLLVGGINPSWALQETYRPFDSPTAAELSAEPLVEWMETLYAAVQRDALSAPNAARVYGYAGITAYEATVPGMIDNRSLSGQLNGLTNLPFPTEDAQYDWLTTLNYTMHNVLTSLFKDRAVESLDSFTTLRDAQVEARREAGIEEVVIENSIEYAEDLSRELTTWIDDDNYAEVEAMTYEMPTDGEGAYILTGEAIQPAEPYWGQIRPFALEYVDECAIPMGMQYSLEEDSPFYAQAMEVMEVGDSLTPEQRDIALWWVDTPGITGAPAGHWISIENQMVELLELPLDRATQMYGMVGIALSDAFVATWSLKYQINLLRPETFINNNLNRGWRPFINTPPFPEYPSGHSTASGAAAHMLTWLFNTVAFTDRTHEERLGGVRSYTSFWAAANEAAISRLYGGIHYRDAIERGIEMGECVSQYALDNIVMNTVTQGGAG